MTKKLRNLLIFIILVVEKTIYAKQTAGLFASIIGKISAQTVAQYFNYINNKPIGKIKYALI